jgi:hypothetical protein
MSCDCFVWPLTFMFGHSHFCGKDEGKVVNLSLWAEVFGVISTYVLPTEIRGKFRWNNLLGLTAIYFVVLKSEIYLNIRGT